MCNRDKANCVIYGVDGTDCHLGSPARSENIIASPAPNELKMWMAEGKGWELASPLMPRVETKSNSDYIDTLIAPYIAIPNVTSPSMKRFIYKSVPHKDKLGRTPLDICSILDPVQSLQCEMLLMTDTHCHFGNSSTYYSANLLPVGASWDVYIKPGRPIEEGSAKKVKCLFFQLSRPARQRKFSRQK